MTPLSILVVDDDRDFAQSLDILLRLEGYAVTQASSGKEAVRAVKTQDFGITLLDLRLPDINGMDCLHEIRRLNPDAKVVMMTAYGARALSRTAGEAGALGIVYKPLAVDDMLLALRAEECGAILVAADGPGAADVVAATLTTAGYAPFTVRGGGALPELGDLDPDIDAVVIDAEAAAANGIDILSQLARLGRPILSLLVVGRSAARDGTDAGPSVSSVTACFAIPSEPEALLATIRARAADSAGAKP